MKPHQAIPVFRTLFNKCCRYLQGCHLPFFANRSAFWVEPNIFLCNGRWSNSSSITQYHQACRTFWGSDSLQKYLRTLSQEYERIGQLLNSCSVNESKRKDLNQRYAELSPLAEKFNEIQMAEKDIQELERMCAELNKSEEKALLELALEEKEGMEQKISALYLKLFENMTPRQKYDESNVLLEVTSGRTTGGDICQQFTQEVFEMYQSYSEYKGWRFEMIKYCPADYGGLHHASARIWGDHVYRHLKFEGGTHRVQRIPQTGLSSRMQRIHTGTMSVIVLPVPEQINIKIDPKDLHIDTFRAKGAGGQHVNTTDSAVRVIHTPTGITVECQQERSQLMNRETALQTLKEKLYHQTVVKEINEHQSARKLQLGTRSQSERIRTYNFTQDRVTDHRIAYEVRDIKEFLSGKSRLDDLISRLIEGAQMQLLAEHLEKNLKSLQIDS